MSDGLSGRSRWCAVPLCDNISIETQVMRVRYLPPLRDLDRARLELVFVVIDNFPQCVGLTLCHLFWPDPMRVFGFDF